MQFQAKSGALGYTKTTSFAMLHFNLVFLPCLIYIFNCTVRAKNVAVITFRANSARHTTLGFE
jgi:hypothetical protein